MCSSKNNFVLNLETNLQFRLYGFHVTSTREGVHKACYVLSFVLESGHEVLTRFP